MTAHIIPMRLESFDTLPAHARRCVFWEVDPAGGGTLSDPEFEKEAWLSMVMLEWGCCGQLAGPADPDHPELMPTEATGYAFYAPPRAVPRAQRFPTGPVSPDAVLLTSVHGEATDMTAELIAAVVNDLIRRGVRALEAFGRTAAVGELADPRMLTASLEEAVQSVGECSMSHCMLDADLLIANGFVVVAPHPYFPRLRLELDKGLRWKAGVEAALEMLLENARLEQPVGLVGGA